MKRGGSRGFVLEGDSVDEKFLNESLEAEQKWLGRFCRTLTNKLQRKETGDSSEYSFSVDFNSGKGLLIIFKFVPKSITI